MKFITIFTLFLCTQLFANYSFSNEKTVKIDMHGGNSEELTNKSGFSNMRAGGLKGLNSFSIKEPKQPMKPEKSKIPELEDIELK